MISDPRSEPVWDLVSDRLNSVPGEPRHVRHLCLVEVVPLVEMLQAADVRVGLARSLILAAEQGGVTRPEELLSDLHLGEVGLLLLLPHGIPDPGDAAMTKHGAAMCPGSPLPVLLRGGIASGVDIFVTLRTAQLVNLIL